MSSGPYLVLPFFGPSTVRDGSGLAIKYTYLDETSILDLNDDEELGLLALDVVETRAFAQRRIHDHWRSIQLRARRIFTESSVRCV